MALIYFSKILSDISTENSFQTSHHRLTSDQLFHNLVGHVSAHLGRIGEMGLDVLPLSTGACSVESIHPLVKVVLVDTHSISGIVEKLRLISWVDFVKNTIF